MQTVKTAIDGNKYAPIFNLIGQKATIFKYSEMGFPQSIQCTINNVEIRKYAQHDNLLHIIYTPKGKRTQYVCRVYDYSGYLIYAGHVALTDAMFVKSTQGDGVTVQESLTCFDGEYLLRAQRSTEQQPIFTQYK